ncbi:MAG TPA: phage holin family protein [Polyangiaceae bacterium]|nr:phage holin family protein [Polyangiaceae bacterium]
MQLIREALDEARELVRLEVALAREEVTTELRQARSSAIVFAGSAVAAVASFTMFLVAIALAFSVPWLAALPIAALLLCVGCALGFAAYKALPAKPMAKTKKRIEADVQQLRERRA